MSLLLKCESLNLAGSIKLKAATEMVEFEGTTSKYFLGVDGLSAALADYYGEDFEEILDMSDFQEDPRTLQEILEAEKEFFDRVWYERSVEHTTRYDDGDSGITEAQYKVSKDAQA